MPKTEHNLVVEEGYFYTDARCCVASSLHKCKEHFIFFTQFLLQKDQHHWGTFCEISVTAQLSRGNGGRNGCYIAGLCKMNRLLVNNNGLAEDDDENR